MYIVDGKIYAADSFEDAFKKHVEYYTDGEHSFFCGLDVFEDPIEVVDSKGNKKSFNATIKKVYVTEVTEC
jgi:hypothetical protein